MTTARSFAPAKVNLALHITGQRDDGYHLLDSLVAFASVGDDVSVSAGAGLTLKVDGPEASGLPTDLQNLALKAIHRIDRLASSSIVLTKKLPASSGIGGGSADAAAAIRAWLAQRDSVEALTEELLSDPGRLLNRHADTLLRLGADVPMCVASRPVHVEGVGERLSFVSLPDVAAVLVNPRIEVSTQAVFGALTQKDNAALPKGTATLDTVDSLIEYLSATRNDLERPACRFFPVIGDVKNVLAQLDGCRLVRMSGSGATCFGLFESVEAATKAAVAIRRRHEDWWVAECVIGDQSRACLPRLT